VKIFKHLTIYQLVLFLKEHRYKIFKFCVLLILPLLVVFILFNFFLIIGSFIFWQQPEYYYIPFNGNYMQNVFDRIMLIGGVLLSLINTYE